MKKDPTLKGIMPPSERNAMIYSLRQKGEPVKEIAKKYDLSISRVNLIYQQIKYIKENYDKWPPLRQRLSNRTKTILISLYGETIFDNPHILVHVGRQGILNIKNVGVKTIREIATLLHDTGLIDSEYRW